MQRKEKINYQEKIDKFCNAGGLKDLAALLNFKAKNLSYILYHLDGGRENQYSSFVIAKKNGGQRNISAPNSALKEVQRRLNDLLQFIYWEKPSVHSFLRKRSIVTNARFHVKKRFVFNIDLEDFFPSINFGRVRGLFISPPYNINPKAATVIAQIACFNNELPQGSPCSPIISNMICSRMDSQLQALAKRERCAYTRYADDITFSTNMPNFSKNIAEINDKKIKVSLELNKIIESNGFKINFAKVRMQTRDMRQEVTGLIVNEFANVRRKLIRQIRAMLYAWEKHGLVKSEEEYQAKYCLNPLATLNGDDGNDIGKNFKRVLEGKISFIYMVRNEKSNKARIDKYNIRNQIPKKDDISFRLVNKFYEQILREGDLPIVRTEGHTDWMHLSAAWSQIAKNEPFNDLKFDFFRVKKDICFGNRKLKTFVETAKDLKPFKKKVICIFDSDDNKINKIHANKIFKFWGNNVYSFVLPGPKGYKNEPISIEFFYPEGFVKTKDEKGRRLFFSDEFNSDGSHSKLKNVKYGYNPRTKKYFAGWEKHLEGKRKIISSGVYQKKGKSDFSIALSKSKFAYNIMKKEKGFENPDFSEFKQIFERIALIIKK